MRATDDEKTSNHDNKEDDENKDQDDDWCTTHLDHGCLTGLTSAMYIDETNFFNKHTSSPSSHPPSANQPPSPDFSAFLAEFSPSDLLSSSYAKAGLYILSRTGTPTKITIQRDQLAFQTGEALQVITKGRFMAVPHFVRGPSLRSSGSEDGQRKKRIARNTLAVFTRKFIIRLYIHSFNFSPRYLQSLICSRSTYLFFISSYHSCFLSLEIFGGVPTSEYTSLQ